jgi:hypothetical protein
MRLLFLLLFVPFIVFSQSGSTNLNGKYIEWEFQKKNYNYDHYYVSIDGKRWQKGGVSIQIPKSFDKETTYGHTKIKKVFVVTVNAPGLGRGSISYVTRLYDDDEIVVWEGTKAYKDFSLANLAVVKSEQEAFSAMIKNSLRKALQ